VTFSCVAPSFEWKWKLPSRPPLSGILRFDSDSDFQIQEFAPGSQAESLPSGSLSFRCHMPCASTSYRSPITGGNTVLRWLGPFACARVVTCAGPSQCAYLKAYSLHGRKHFQLLRSYDVKQRKYLTPYGLSSLMPNLLSCPLVTLQS